MAVFFLLFGLLCIFLAAMTCSQKRRNPQNVHNFRFLVCAKHSYNTRKHIKIYPPLCYGRAEIRARHAPQIKKKKPCKIAKRFCKAVGYWREKNLFLGSSADGSVLPLGL